MRHQGMPSELIVARDIHKRFGGVQALRGVSITLRAGQVRCLVGENGCGKSTLIKTITGVHAPDSGDLVIGGVRHRRLRPIEALRAGIHAIYQDFSLFPNLTVAENIALSSALERGRRLVRWREMRRIATRALADLEVEIDPRREVAELPVAGKQLVAIARALADEACLVVMDEPTTALVTHEGDTLFGVVEKLQRRGVSVLFVSHKLGEVLEISEQITVLREGKKVAEGPATEFDSRSLARHMTGREVAESSYIPPQEGADIEPALRVEQLSRRGAFEDISLTVRPGEIVGLSGLRGSGRTALAQALFGLRPAQRGQVFVRERPVACRDVTESMRAGIAYVPEDRLTEGLFLEQSIERNVAVGILDGLRSRIGLIDSRKVGAVTARWVDRFRIRLDSTRDPVDSLSGGNQQKVLLARWLARDAEVLILGGPTVGVDIGSKSDIHDKLKELASEGLAILVISDDLAELAALANRILVMHRGRLVDELVDESLDDRVLVARLGELR